MKSMLCAALLALSASASASVITLNLTTSINGTPPSATGTLPWLTATISDVGANTVQVSMKNNLASGQYVSQWLFNVNSSLTDLSYRWDSGYAAWSITDDVYTVGSSAIKGGLFDIDFIGQRAADSRFVGGMTSVYTFTGSGLSASSFLAPSLSDGRNGGYLSAADVAGIVGGLSGSIGTSSVNAQMATVIPEQSSGQAPVNVPEPASALLLGVGLVGLIAGLRRRG